MARQPFTLRMTPEFLSRLERQARNRGAQKTPLAERLLDEALRMAEHPGIYFRDSAVGRYPALLGRRIPVWHVVETIQQNNGDLQAAADWYQLPLAMMQAAADYYADYRDEIDREIAENDRLAREAEEAERRRRDALGK